VEEVFENNSVASKFSTEHWEEEAG